MTSTPQLEELVADLARDAEAGRGVLGVGDDEIDLMVLDERRRARGGPARGPGLPTMSPMKRMRITRSGLLRLRSESDRAGRAARRSSGSVTRSSPLLERRRAPGWRRTAPSGGRRARSGRTRARRGESSSRPVRGAAPSRRRSARHLPLTTTRTAPRSTPGRSIDDLDRVVGLEDVDGRASTRRPACRGRTRGRAPRRCAAPRRRTPPASDGQDDGVNSRSHHRHDRTARRGRTRRAAKLIAHASRDSG